MGTTSTGLPFPEDYDPVSETAAAIQALAQAVADTMQSGVVATGAFSAVNTPKSTAVTFDPPFPAGSQISVTLNPVNSNPHQCAVGLAAAPTVSGFSVRSARTTGTAGFDVHWQAVVRTDV